MLVKTVDITFAIEKRVGDGSGIIVPYLFIIPFAFCDLFMIPFAFFPDLFIIHLLFCDLLIHLRFLRIFLLFSLLRPTAIQILLSNFRCNGCA